MKAKTILLTKEDGTHMSLRVYTEKDREEILSKFFSQLSDTLQALRDLNDEDPNGAWIITDGLGNYLRTQGDIFDILSYLPTE